MNLSVTVPSAAKVKEYEESGELVAKLRDKKPDYQVVLRMNPKPGLPMEKIVEMVEKPVMGTFDKWITKQQIGTGYLLEYESILYGKRQFASARVLEIDGKWLDCSAQTKDLALRAAMTAACDIKPTP